MTGIVMCGRTGASFAAGLGTMTVNEEVDALRTMGLRPAEFLVPPRVLATALMLPALVAYADLLGLLGGMFVGVAVLGIGTMEFLQQTRASLRPAPRRHRPREEPGFRVRRGPHRLLLWPPLRAERRRRGRGDQKAVVMGIVLVVVVDAVATVILHVLGL